MERHFGYWAEQMHRGTALVYGPVADPAGSYGIAIVDVAGEAQAKSLGAQDPAVTAGLGFRFAVYAMPDALVKQAPKP